VTRGEIDGNRGRPVRPQTLAPEIELAQRVPVDGRDEALASDDHRDRRLRFRRRPRGEEENRQRGERHPSGRH